ncbi:hypothetical protein PCP30_15805 [Pseudomonas aeruginosa]|uniref:hypothetical protein n=1 Tax=Pseudomonas aeruginosa TaxID=287 RepID=UPI00093B81C6|nr:hypothetical protein [Pseudomonas aeruginosa]
MTQFIAEQSLESRMRHAISVAWQIFSRKVGGGLIAVNKEASMQLQYAFVLKQILPLILHARDESAELELETGVRLPTGPNNIDILVIGRSGSREIRIALELKCYRNITASGGKRGAQDIFHKDVYQDLEILEAYVAAGIAHRGIALVMNDHAPITMPIEKKGKFWAYDISHGAHFAGGTIDVAIGGKPVKLTLSRSYSFDWHKFGGIWFMELEGTTTADAIDTLPVALHTDTRAHCDTALDAHPESEQRSESQVKGNRPANTPF